MRQIKTFIKAVPPLLIAMDGMAFVFAIYGQTWIKDAMYFHREMFGHSLVLIAYMTYFSYRFKVCAYTWASLTTLLLINLLNLIYFFVPLEYLSWYGSILCLYVIEITLIYAIQSNTRNRPRRIV